MAKLSQIPNESEYSSVKESIRISLKKIHLQLKGEKFREQLKDVESSLENILCENRTSEEKIEDLRKITSFINNVIEADRAHILERIIFAFLHIVELLSKIL